MGFYIWCCVAGGSACAVAGDAGADCVGRTDTSSCTRDVEPLMRRLQSIAAEIDELAACREPQSTPADVIRERREARLRKGAV